MSDDVSTAAALRALADVVDLLEGTGCLVADAGLVDDASPAQDGQHRAELLIDVPAEGISDEGLQVTPQFGDVLSDRNAQVPDASELPIPSPAAGTKSDGPVRIEPDPLADEEADPPKIEGKSLAEHRDRLDDAEDGEQDDETEDAEPESNQDAEEGQVPCAVDGCEETFGSERAMKIHRTKAHGGDDDEAEDEAADDAVEDPSVEEEILAILDKAGELPSSEIKKRLETSSSHYRNVLSALQREDRVEARSDPEDRRRNLYRLADADDGPAPAPDDVDEDAEPPAEPPLDEDDETHVTWAVEREETFRAAAEWFEVTHATIRQRTHKFEVRADQDDAGTEDANGGAGVAVDVDGADSHDDEADGAETVPVDERDIPDDVDPDATTKYGSQDQETSESRDVTLVGDVVDGPLYKAAGGGTGGTGKTLHEDPECDPLTTYEQTNVTAVSEDAAVPSRGEFCDECSLGVNVDEVLGTDDGGSEADPAEQSDAGAAEGGDEDGDASATAPDGGTAFVDVDINNRDTNAPRRLDEASHTVAGVEVPEDVERADVVDAGDRADVNSVAALADHLGVKPITARYLAMRIDDLHDELCGPPFSDRPTSAGAEGGGPDA